MITFYEDGPLKGMASLDVLVGARETEILKTAAEQLGRDLEDLARCAIEEAALDYARSHGLPLKAEEA